MQLNNLTDAELLSYISADNHTPLEAEFIRRLEFGISNAQEDYDDLKQECADLEERVEELEGELDECENENASLQNDLDEAKDKIFELEAVVESYANA